MNSLKSVINRGAHNFFGLVPGSEWSFQLVRTVPSHWLFWAVGQRLGCDH